MVLLNYLQEKEECNRNRIEYMGIIFAYLITTLSIL